MTKTLTFVAIIPVLGIIAYCGVCKYIEFDNIRTEIRDQCCLATYQTVNDPDNILYGKQADYICAGCYDFGTCIAKKKVWYNSMTPVETNQIVKECWYYTIAMPYLYE